MRQLQMRRETLEDLPNLELPPGYALRTADPFDAEEVGNCVGAAFDEGWGGADWAKKNLFDDPTVDVTLAIWHGDSIAATASARSLPEQPEVGYVHWVATRPGHTGKALGYWASLAVLHEFVRRGKTCAILDTDDPRIPAIKTYLKLGFEPWMTDGSHPGRWTDVLAQIRG